MKLLFIKYVALAIAFMILIYYAGVRYREGLAPGFSPGLTPGSDSSVLSTEFCAAINQINTSNQSDIDRFLKESKDNNAFTNNEKQIILGIEGNQAIYQGQFLEIQKKLCKVFSTIKQINTKLPKTSADIGVGTVGQCLFDQGLKGGANITIDIKPNPGDPEYAQWKINAILPSGPPGDKGRTGDQGDPGKAGPPGDQGDRGIRGDWEQKPNPTPEDTQVLGFFKNVSQGSIY